MKNCVFIQARLSSSRLPKKILKKIDGKTILELIVERLKKISIIDDFLLVTGPEELNQELILEAKNLDIKYFSGNENNILDRFYQASRKIDCDYIIRITGDNPIIDIDLINRAYAIAIKNNYDIISIDENTYPIGINFDIIKKQALQNSWKLLKNAYTNEKNFFDEFHSPCVHLQTNNTFNSFVLKNPKKIPKLRLTIDYEEDFQLVSHLYSELYSQNNEFAISDILELFNKNPSIKQKYTINN